MRNFRQDGTRMRYTAGADIGSGDLVVVGVRVGVATADIANGATGELAMEGVYELPKLASDNIAQGALVYWDATPGEITTTSSGNTLVGYAHAAAGAATTTCNVKINA